MREEICPKCGKIFIPAPQHIFQEGGHCWCKWTCWNHRYEKDPKKGGKVARFVEMVSLNGKQKRIFTSATSAAAFTGYNINGIRDACREKKPYMKFMWHYVER